MYSYRHVSVKKKGRETIIDLSDSDCPWLDWPMGERQPRFHTYLLACFPWWIHSGAKGKGQECKWMTVAALKARDFIRDSTFMFWNNANDFACVVVSQYQSALQSITIALLLLRMRNNNNAIDNHCIVVVTHAYCYQIQLPNGRSTRNEIKI